MEKKTRYVTQEDTFSLASELNSQQLDSIPYFETSSISGQNVDRVFDFILNHCLPLDNAQGSSKRSSSVVDLSNSKNTPSAKSGCCR